jgi:hypothetical protein
MQAMPTRRIFELTVIVGVLLWPARATVRTWGKRMLGSAQPGSLAHNAGQVVVTIL